MVELTEFQRRRWMGGAFLFPWGIKITLSNMSCHGDDEWIINSNQSKVNTYWLDKDDAAGTWGNCIPDERYDQPTETVSGTA